MTPYTYDAGPGICDGCGNHRESLRTINTAQVAGVCMCRECDVDRPAVSPPPPQSPAPVDHDLKIWPEPFAALLAGTKHHEVRKDDRGFAVGHVLHLREYEPQREWTEDGHRIHPSSTYDGYTGRSFRAKVTHITAGGQFGLPADLCVMSIELLEGDAPIAAAIAAMPDVAGPPETCRSYNPAGCTQREDGSPIAPTACWTCGAGKVAHDRWAAHAAVKSDVAPTVQPRPPCEGLTARWCPNCGTCCCPQDGDLNDENCPLHSHDSTHPIAPTVGQGCEVDRCEICDRADCRREVTREAYNADPHHDLPLKLSRPEPPTFAALEAAYEDCQRHRVTDWRERSMAALARVRELEAEIAAKDERIAALRDLAWVVERHERHDGKPCLCSRCKLSDAIAALTGKNDKDPT